MEDQVYLVVREKKQFIRHFSNFIHHLKGSKIPRTELLKLVILQGILAVRLQFQINPITHCKLPIRTMFVVLLLHAVLCTPQMMLEDFYHSLTSHQAFINIMNS